DRDTGNPGGGGHYREVREQDRRQISSPNLLVPVAAVVPDDACPPAVPRLGSTATSSTSSSSRPYPSHFEPCCRSY
ncbi:unnamed protein product, partial [Amoebophrya sp. A25]